MPRITSLTENQVTARPLPDARVSPLRDTRAESIGAAVGDVGNVLIKVQEEERRKADRASFMEADRKLGEQENALLFDPERGAFNKRGKDAFDVGSSALGEYDKQASEIENGLTSKRAKLAFREASTQRRQNIERDLMRHESREREGFYASEREAYKASAQSAAINYYTQPNRIESEIERVRAAIDQTPGMSAEQRATELGERKSAIYRGVIGRYVVNEDLAGATNYYDSVKDRIGGEAATAVENDLRILRDRLEAKRESNVSTAKAALQSQVGDIETAVRMGVAVPSENIPSRARFTSLYGDEIGGKMYDQVQLYASASVEASKIANLPSAQVARLATDYAASVVPDGRIEGARGRAEVAQVVGTIANANLNQRAKDPIAYLQMHSPAVQRTYAAFAEDPSESNRAAYLASLSGERQRLQIPGDSILSNGEAASVIDRMTRFDDSQQLAASIAQEERRWGKAWPQVFGQIGKDLPDVAFTIPNIPQKPANLLSSIAGLTDDELKKRLPVGQTWNDLSERVRTDLADFRESFPIDGTPAYAKVQSATEKLAVAYVGQGMSLSNAVKQAVNDVSEDRYTFSRYNQHVYRVPKSTDADAVDIGASIALSKLSLPDSVVGIGGRFPVEVEKERLTAQIKRDGYWVTNPDETGLWLFAGLEPVGHPPIGYTWQQLTDMAGTRKKPSAAESRNQALYGNEFIE